MPRNFYRIFVLIALWVCQALPREKSPDVLPPRLQFDYLTTADGLASNKITAILRDGKGFMWLAAGGLNRYDGHSFEVFKNDPNSYQSLSDNNIFCLFEDHKGVLWIGTWHGGLNKFDRSTESFHRYQHDPDNPLSLSHNRVTSIIEFPEKSGKLWVSTRGGGVDYFNPETETFEHFRHDPENPESLSSNYVITSYLDHQGVLWFGARDGLNRFRPVSKSFTRFIHDPKEPNSLNPGAIMSLCEDRQGKLWVATLQGLSRFDRARERFLRYELNSKELIGRNQLDIMAMNQGPFGALLLGTRYEGLFLFDPESETLHHIKTDPLSPLSISDNLISSIYKDDTGDTWIATANGGAKLLKLNPFEIFKKDDFNPGGLISNNITGICEDSTGKIWVGTVDKGLACFDRKKNVFQYFQHNPVDDLSLSDNNVIVVFVDSYGELWAGTQEGILNRFNAADNSFKRYLPYFSTKTNRISSASGTLILSLYEDTNRILWVGTWSGGLHRFDRESETFDHFLPDPKNEGSLSDSDVSCIYEAPDEPNVLWIGTYKGGLNRFDKKSKTFKAYKHEPRDTTTISSNFICTIQWDPSGALWIGTVNGALNRFDRETGMFTRFGESKGLTAETVQGILPDEKGNLWLSTSDGIWRLNVQNMFFKKYDTRDGIPGNEFSFQGYCKLRSGEMVFSGKNGFTIFHPDSIRDNPHIPPIVFTGLKRYNSDEAAGSAIDEIGISEKREVEFLHTENIFTVEFAALNFRIPEKNQYAYKLEGFNEQWIQLGNKHDVTFTNLDAGEYTLRVKGTNNDGLWNEEGAALKITVHPPWWKTSWAYTIYGLLFGALFFSLRKYDLNRQRLKTRADHLAEVDRLKSRFFANISHEFRTPLTLIKGPVEKWLPKITIPDMKQDFEIIRRNSNRLLQLISQLLELSKLESGRLKLQAQPENIVKLLRLVTQSFESLAKQSGIDLQFLAFQEKIVAYVESEKIEKIFVNLLSNAFKFTPRGGVVTVKVTMVDGADNSLKPSSRTPGGAFQRNTLTKYSTVSIKLHIKLVRIWTIPMKPRVQGSASPSLKS